MSHFTRLKTKMTKLSCIKKALMAMGFKEHMIEIFDTPVQLKGYQGDTRKQKAHIRIKGSAWGNQNYVGQASNDLGLEREADGSYSLHVSDYDRRKYNEHWQLKLVNQYAKATVEEHCKTHNFHIAEEHVEADGEIVMRLRSQF